MATSTACLQRWNRRPGLILQGNRNSKSSVPFFYDHLIVVLYQLFVVWEIYGGFVCALSWFSFFKHMVLVTLQKVLALAARV